MSNEESSTKNLLEIWFDNPIDRNKISIWIRPNSPIGINVKVEVDGRGLIDVNELNSGGPLNRAYISGGSIGPLRSVNLIIQGGDAGPELVKALRGAANQLDRELKDQSTPK
ncbi:MAG: hypothetical protein ACYDHX_04905 [Methanothrix sp.]